MELVGQTSGHGVLAASVVMIVLRQGSHSEVVPSGTSVVLLVGQIVGSGQVAHVPELVLSSVVELDGIEEVGQVTSGQLVAI